MIIMISDRCPFLQRVICIKTLDITSLFSRCFRKAFYCKILYTLYTFVAVSINKINSHSCYSYLIPTLYGTCSKRLDMTQFYVLKCNDFEKAFEQEWKVGELQGPNIFQVCAKRKKKKNYTWQKQTSLSIQVTLQKLLLFNTPAFS